jgi:glycosyltransferase involved in cell wall biosynthesis
LFHKVRIVKESSEVPFHRKEKPSAINKFLIKAEYKMYDGLIVITERLKDLFTKEFSIKAKILIVPILSNSCMLGSKKILNKKKRTLVYTGSLHDHKDGITIILKAFAKILETHTDIKLIMTGDLDKTSNKQNILNLVNELKINNDVDFPGYVSLERLNELTTSATALLLAKPDNRQNRYNMATKIGEYLLSGETSHHYFSRPSQFIFKAP